MANLYIEPVNTSEDGRSRPAPILLIAAAVFAVLVVAGATVVAVRSGTSTNARAAKRVHGSIAFGSNALNRPAPTFDLERLDGSGQVSLSRYRGSVVVLNFWRSDCAPCRQEFPLLRAATNRRGVNVVGVNADAIVNDAQAFARTERAMWPQALDENLAVGKAYGVASLPQTFFVRPDGTIALIIYGRLDKGLLDAGIRASRSGPATADR